MLFLLVELGNARQSADSDVADEPGCPTLTSEHLQCVELKMEMLQDVPTKDIRGWILDEGWQPCY